jgi:hypothetical protein
MRTHTFVAVDGVGKKLAEKVVSATSAARHRRPSRVLLPPAARTARPLRRCPFDSTMTWRQKLYCEYTGQGSDDDLGPRFCAAAEN